jgi:hypothetical protein
MAGLAVAEKAPLTVGVFSGVSLLACLGITAALPTLAAPALEAGSYFGIVSITNMWLAVYRDQARGWLQGVRGFLFSLVLTVSLIGDFARLLGSKSAGVLPLDLPLPAVPVPSALTMELIAALLIVVDPLLVRSVVKWVAEGAEYQPPHA